MTVQLEARFESRRAADEAVAGLRRGGVLFDVLSIRPTGGFAADDSFKMESSLPQAVAMGHICARMLRAAEAARAAAGGDAALLRISLRESGVGRASQLLRSMGAWGVRQDGAG